MTFRALAITAVLLVAFALPSAASDWPQWQGPNRDNVSKETGLLKSWPKDGPKLLWTYEKTGSGFSGPAIVGDRLYILGDRGDSQYVIALDVTSTMVTEAWATKIGPVFENSYGNGPRSTPTVDGDRVYVLAASGSPANSRDSQGMVACLDVASGKIVWEKSLKGDLNGQMMSGWGYSESPLIDGDKLVCTPGGSKGTLAALDKKTGEVLWRSKELTDPAAYSSAIVAEVGGVRQYLQTTGKAVVGVAAKDGKLLWRHPKPEYRTAVIPTPIFHNDLVYVTAGYQVGCELLRLSSNSPGVKAESVYVNNRKSHEQDNVENKHGGVVLVGDHIYGWSDGPGRGRWVCQDFKTGKVVCQSEKLGRGSITYADGRLYCYAERDGTVVLIEASPKEWIEHGRFKIPKTQKPGSVWTHPVVANGRLYLRDQELLYCYDVRAN